MFRLGITRVTWSKLLLTAKKKVCSLWVVKNQEVSSAQMAWNSDTKMMYHFGGFSGGQNSLKDGDVSIKIFENKADFQFTHCSILEMINGKILGEKLDNFNWLVIQDV